jgi:hypothetical protein
MDPRIKRMLHAPPNLFTNTASATSSISNGNTCRRCIRQFVLRQAMHSMYCRNASTPNSRPVRVPDPLRDSAPTAVYPALLPAVACSLTVSASHRGT